MARYALPNTVVTNPRIGKSSPVLENFAVVRSLFMICAGHNRGITMELNFQIVRFLDVKVGLRICRKGYLFRLVNDAAIGLGHHKIVRQEFLKGDCIMVQFGLVPIVLGGQNFSSG